MKVKIAAVIPAYNEEKHVWGVCEKAVEFADAVFVVDDGSIDSTASKASLDGSVPVVRHVRNVGVGAALETGIRSALRLKPQVVVTLDADGQHKPEEIPALAEPVLKRQAHIAVGGRDFHTMSLPRRASNVLTAKLLNSMFHVDLPDVQCGFRAIRGDVAPLLLGWSKGYPWACEMLIKAEALNLKMASAPIATIKPESSHIKPLTETLRFLNMLLRRRKTQRLKQNADCGPREVARCQHVPNVDSGVECVGEVKETLSLHVKHANFSSQKGASL